MASKPVLHSEQDLQARRRIKTVQSLQVLTVTPQQTLDDICEIAARTMRGDGAIIALSDETHYNIIGSYSVTARRYRSDIMAEVWDEDRINALYDLQNSSYASVHPAMNGEVDRLESTLYAALHHEGHVIGIIAVGARTPIGPYTETERRIMARLRRVTEATIKAEAALSRLAAEAFRALERIRREDI